MSEKAKAWSPHKEHALKALLEQTLKDAGDIPPEMLPGHLKRALAGYASGDLDLDAYIEKVLAARRETR